MSNEDVNINWYAKKNYLLRNRQMNGIAGLIG